MGNGKADGEAGSGGLKGEIEKRKQHLQALKQGMPSGISDRFGSALDLLPEPELKQYLRGDKPYVLGESLQSEGADPDSFSKALDGLLESFKGQVPIETAGVSIPDGYAGDSSIIAVLYEKEKRRLLFADGSEMHVPKVQAADDAGQTQDPT